MHKSTSSDTHIGEKMGQRMGASATPATEGMMGQRSAGIVGSRDNTSGPGPEIMAADTLEGDNVYNAEGEKLGEIEHVMVDVPRGRIAYAVLSFGGFLGMGEKLFAIPWSALTLDADHHNFVLNVPKQRLKDAPGFDKDHWPVMADPRWASNVHSYYATRPYWEM
jgi:sporulation protein YlmC with PRC-barrel domain